MYSNKTPSFSKRLFNNFCNTISSKLHSSKDVFVFVKLKTNKQKLSLAVSSKETAKRSSKYSKTGTIPWQIVFSPSELTPKITSKKLALELNWVLIHKIYQYAYQKHFLTVYLYSLKSKIVSCHISYFIRCIKSWIWALKMLQLACGNAQRNVW